MGKRSLNIFLIRKALNTIAVPLIVISSLYAIIASAPTHTSLASYQHVVQEQLQIIRDIVFKNVEEHPRYSMHVTATAYSSTVGQTDSTPCIAARGYDLCKYNKENVIASNFLPIGTKVRFPEIDPHKFYTVVDVMSDRFTENRVDFWKSSKDRAKTFGKKWLIIEVY